MKRSTVIGYLILATLLLTTLGIFLIVPPLAGKKEGAILLLAMIYVVWSFWYHRRRGDLTARVLLEYFLVAILGGVILYSLV